MKKPYPLSLYKSIFPLPKRSNWKTVIPLLLFSNRVYYTQTKNPPNHLIKTVSSFSTQKQPDTHQNVEKGDFIGPGFIVKQMMISCLAIYSYYIESGNQCFLIDPMNQISKYEQVITNSGKTLKGVFLTHYHADYIAGHLQLKKKYNCDIYVGPKGLSTFGIKVLKDNQQIKVGKIKLRVIHTPGHTQESSCILLTDSNGNEQCIFTGDTLFLNEVGRPDLAVKTNLSAKDLATMLYNSLQKIKSLKDDIRIYPGHGAGSSCGKNIGKGDFCTIGAQKQNNYALKQETKQKFVDSVLRQMPQPPQYFPYNVGINKFKPFDFSEAYQKVTKKLSIQQVRELLHKQKAIIIDSRAKESQMSGMIKNSISIDFDGPFAVWVGTLLPPDGKFIIFGEEERAKQSIKRMLRIGYIGVCGYFSDDVKSLPKDFEVYTPQFVDFLKAVNIEKRTIVDVRKPNQWKKGIAVGDVVQLQVSKIQTDHMKALDKSKKYVVHCHGGYRSRAAYSILKSLNYDVTCYADGGFGNFQKIGIKTMTT